MSPSGNLRLGWTGVASTGQATGPRTEPIRLSSGTSRRPRLPMRSHSAFTMISHLVKEQNPMHSIVLLTALSATTGLFGGGHGKAKHCGRLGARGHCVSAPAPVSHYQPQPNCGTAPLAQYPPTTPMGPAPQMMAPPMQAAAPHMQVPQTAYSGYQSYYAPPAYNTPAPSCAGGTCARR